MVGYFSTHAMAYRNWYIYSVGMDTEMKVHVGIIHALGMHNMAWELLLIV